MVSLPRVTVHVDLDRVRILLAPAILVVEKLTAVAAWPEAGLLGSVVWRLDWFHMAHGRRREFESQGIFVRFGWVGRRAKL
jgi:hypothetical protein